MKEHYYRFQLVGNDTSIKRMVASLYLSNAKKQDQTLKVCICDDLPHIVSGFDEHQRLQESNELLQAGLPLSVSFERTLTVSASIMNNQDYVCAINPDYEVVIPPETIWAPGATVVVEFKVHMLKANENASLQISILSQDEGGNEIPLSVPPRAHLMWQPKNVAGVTRIREAWESSSDGSISPQRRSWAVRQGPQPYFQQYTNQTHKSVSLPRHQQPAFSKVDTVVQKKLTRMQEVEEELRKEEQRLRYQEERMTREEERKRKEEERLAAAAIVGQQRWNGGSVSPQENDWNVVRDPRTHIPEINGAYDTNGDPLPDWAKGLGDDFNYDDVVVV